MTVDSQSNDVIFGPQVADGGTYTCKVSNVAGQVDRTFRLTVHGTEAVISMYSPSLEPVQLFSLPDFDTSYSSTSPGRFTMGALKLHPWFTRGAAMSGHRIPCADYHLAERWNSYWSVLY